MPQYEIECVDCGHMFTFDPNDHTPLGRSNTYALPCPQSRDNLDICSHNGDGDLHTNLEIVLDEDKQEVREVRLGMPWYER